MGKRLVLMGAGHVHLTVLKKLKEYTSKGHEVVVVSMGEHHYYSGMGPGMLGGYYAPEHIRFDVRRLTEKGGGVFVNDRIVSIDPDNRRVRLSSGGDVEYDAASLNLGSVIPSPDGDGAEKTDSVFPVKPIENLMQVRRRVLGLVHRGNSRIAVVGGGPAAAETAGNIWRCAKQCIRAKGGKLPRIVLLAGRGVMRHYPDKVGELARESLRERGIEINEEGYADSIEENRVVLETGEIHEADAIFTALGTRPPKILEEAGLPVGPGGGISVNEYLQCTERPELFGGGDCIHFSPEPLDRVGVHAVKENPVLHRNLLAALGEGEFTKFEPQSKYMLIFNMGDGTGLLWRGDFACRNRPAFWLKNWIDKRFIRKFQA